MSVALQKNLWLYRLTFISAALGTLFITASPFFGDTLPLKNNYIPVLQNPLFFMGLSLFGCGVFLQSLLTISSYSNVKNNIVKTGAFFSSIITLIAFLCFTISYTKNPYDGDAHHYYELLFWGGGHILQYTFTATVLVVWLILANASNINIPLGGKAITIMLALNMIFTLPTPLIYLSENSYSIFTQHMRYFNGVSALIIGGAIFFGWFKKAKTSYDTSHNVKACLIFSIIMFGYGGLLAYMISGTNATIPAHYHGSIVSITLAFMGLCYFLLPEFGYAKATGKTASIQPYIYFIGQFIHITGLAWMGGYGALRKDAASSAAVTNIMPKLMFFSGGAISIIGGFLFVVIMIMCIKKGKNLKLQS